jgi:hypothetical protein
MALDTRTAKLAGVGGFAVAGAVVVIYAAFVFLIHPVQYGGMNQIMFFVGCLSVGVVCAALIAAHIAVGLQLLKYRDY